MITELLNKAVRATRPSLDGIRSDYVYHARKQVMDQEERVQTLRESLVQAEALLQCRRDRLVQLQS